MLMAVIQKIKQKYLQSTTFHELIRFALVGGIATVIHYLLYLSLLRFIKIDALWWENTAYSIGYVIAFICNLWLTAHFTFKTVLNVKRSGGFLLSHLITLLNHLIFFNFFRYVGLSEKWAPIPVFILAAAINFLLVRFVFKSNRFKSEK